jgi:hypothetical protein
VGSVLGADFGGVCIPVGKKSEAHDGGDDLLDSSGINNKNDQQVIFKFRIMSVQLIKIR